MFILSLILPQIFLLPLIQFNEIIIADFQIWRLVTSMFLHGDLQHLIYNLMGILWFGAVVEDLYEKWQYLTIYFVSGVFGSLFTLIILPPATLSLGASGAVYGLVAVVFLQLYRQDQFTLILGIVYLAASFIGSLAPGVNLWAHLFGFAGGALCHYIFKKRIQRNYAQSGRRVVYHRR